MSEWQTSEPNEQRKRLRKEEGDENKRKEEAKKRKEDEEVEKKKEEEEEEKRKEEEEEHKRKEEEEKKRKEDEHKRKEAEQKRKEEEEAEGGGGAQEERDLLFSPMHIGTNWALLVINIQEKEFHVYDSLRNKDRRDIPQDVEELRIYMKGKHIDSENWSLRYPDPCPQQGSGDDFAIFTCKYMECLAHRDTQGFPFSQNDMLTERAKFALHFIKAYFNAQEERSERI
ncbi:hypothetical protein Taro_022969 [Colocasia esculenta]|uniref:Ubiquitin-like protease family profile domain-containing protein n=1 Tax=Colocasia esculenta TaxID=4460 RepID=A0A843V3C0_COLES|nr:hypothetical protein [Colocasia esculenta]